MENSANSEKTRRERILETALFLFRKQGYEATSTREIGEKTGTSKANVYHHFRTKDGLLHALLDPLFDEVEAAASSSPAGP